MSDTLETIGDGMVVAFHYTLRDDEGEEIDRSEEGDPMEYLHGASNIVEGLEEALSGKSVGAAFAVIVPPEKGYGVRDEAAVVEVPREAFPEDADLDTGTEIVIENDDGESESAWVSESDDQKVILDRNHPLAGYALHFEIAVASIRRATAEELAHGHPHGPEGHHHH